MREREQYKLFKVMLLIFAVAIGYSGIFCKPVKCSAKTKNEFHVVEYLTSVMKKSNKKLVIKTDKRGIYKKTSSGTKYLNTKKLVYKISSKCKWLSFSVDDTDLSTGKTTYHKSSYEKIKKRCCTTTSKLFGRIQGYGNAI